jgi:hypothetical protein
MVFFKKTYWVIYLFVFSLIAILILIALVLPANYFFNSPITIISLSLSIGGALLYQFLRFKHKLIITKHEIKSEGFFLSKTIKTNIIEGFETYYVKSTTTGVGHYSIKQKKTSSKTIKIYPNYKNQIELTNWIKNNLTDLNSVKNQEEKAEAIKRDVFDAENLERDPIKRAIKIQTAKKVKLILNTVSILLAILFFFPSWCFDYLLIFIVLLPLVALISMLFSKGFLRLNLLAKTFVNMFNRKKKYDTNLKSEYFSDVSLTFIIPSLLVLFLVLKNYNLIDFKLVWTPAFVGLIFIVLILGVQLVLKRLKFISLVFLIPFLMAYTYGSTIVINCVFDSSENKIATYKVRNKSTGREGKQGLIKHYYYRVNVINWLGEAGRYKKLNITKEHYDRIKIGADIDVSFKAGYFNIPWYEVIDN